MPQTRSIRIGGCSGSSADRRDAMRLFAANHQNDPVDVIVGDWMSEANMTTKGSIKTADSGNAYEASFLEALEPALLDIAKHKIKVAANAGAADTEKLCHVVMKLVKSKGLDLNVAWISGDEVLPAVQKAMDAGHSQFENIYTGEVLRDWKFKPIYAQAYLGGLGIATAFAEGADIVICGRVADASPIIGSACWWHKWKRTDLDQLANAFVAGHLIECSNYVCGGNYTGFKSLEDKGWDDIGYPIAELSSEGGVVITKSQGSGGEVSINTCSSQLLYEIQGPWYFNSDVTAILDSVWFEQLSTDRVAVHGVKSAPPPATTKVGLTAHGGYQAEFHWFMVGLDIAAKARMMERQIRKLLGPARIQRLSKLTFTLHGTAPENPTSQAAATVDMRVLAQAPVAEALAPKHFARPCIDPIMQGYPGATPHLDLRMAFPRPIHEYYVTLLPQADIRHRVHLPWRGGETLDIPPPPQTRVWDKMQPSQPTTTTIGGAVDPATAFGKTVRGPLGWLVHARSGDKGSDCNVGFWVRHQDEWDWLRGLLSVAKMEELLADEFKGKPIVSAPHLPSSSLSLFSPVSSNLMPPNFLVF